MKWLKNKKPKEKKEKKPLKNRLIYSFAWIAFILVIIAGGIGTNNVYQAKKQAVAAQNAATQDEQTQKEMQEAGIDVNAPKYEKVDGVTNILLIGADIKKGQTVGRSDSTMILTLDSNHNKIKLTSLLRDVLVYIPGHGKGKFNHSFAYGQAPLLLDTIRNNYGIYIDKYIIIDFNNFKSLIDAVGGVDVEIEDFEVKEFNKCVNLTEDTIKGPGKYTFNGDQALAYSRIRYNTGGEQKRTDRQRKVIYALYQKMKEVSVSNYPAIISSLSEFVQTEMNASEEADLLFTACGMNSPAIETLQIPDEGLCKSGIYKDYGWVFRTDLKKQGEIIDSFINEDKKLTADDFKDETINYIE